MKSNQIAHTIIRSVTQTPTTDVGSKMKLRSPSESPPSDDIIDLRFSFFIRSEWKGKINKAVSEI